MTAPSEKAPPLKRGSFAVDPNFTLNQRIKVAVRMRPLSDDQEKAVNNNSNGKKKQPEKRAWGLSKTGAMDTLTQLGAVRRVDGRNMFHFDQIFDEDTQTPLVYKSIARQMVKTVLDGKHATIFAYGQTGSGKTFTMQGDGKKQSGQAGIIQLVASDLFRFMRQGQANKRDFIVKVSYIEIYNERIRDLLSDDVGSTASHGTHPAVPSRSASITDKVQIRATASGDIAINCVKVEVKSVDEVLDYLVSGNSQRVVAKTDMNQHSSRSHAIFRLSVESREKDDPAKGPINDVLRVSDFNLVDLAGSESVKVSNTSGLRQREGAKINQSLLTLSSVIHNLSLPDNKRPRHINFRDSKLTRILQPHLTGNAEMAILCCISPSKSFLEESRSTLKFASRAKLVKVTPKINEVLDDSAMIKKLEHELAQAKREIEEMKRDLGSPSIQRPPTRTQSTGTASKSGDSVDYGYQDMESLPQKRAYVMPKNQQIPDIASFGSEDRRMSNPQASRPYVMPKNHGMQDPAMNEYLNRRNSLNNERNSLHERNSLNEQNDTSSPGFRLDAVDPAAADKVVFRYMNGRTSSNEDLRQVSPIGSQEENSPSGYGNSVDRESALGRDFPMPAGKYLGYGGDGGNNSKSCPASYGSPEKNGTTARTEEESLDGPEGSYGEISLKFGSVVSKPETLKAASVRGDDQRSRYGTLDSAADHALDGRAGDNTVSWDTMDLNTTRDEQVGQPMRAMQSLYDRDAPVPEEITIISSTLSNGDEGKEKMGIADRLNDAEERANFLEGKLEMSDDLIEAVFKDLERARLCIHDLVYRNVKLSKQLNKKRREEIKIEYQEGEAVIEQYWLLKGSMYVGLFFFFTGGFEFFMASVILIWLILEVNLS